MAKNMYQKREERKSKKMNDDGKSFSNVSINWYPGHMAKTKRQIIEDLKLIDVIIELLDARIPVSSQNPDIARIVEDKKRIILLNKSDLAEPMQTDKWIEYFNKKSITALAVDSNSGFGIEKCLKKIEEVMEEDLKKYALKGRINKTIRVMILGIPNVGKSSFINRISKKTSAQVANRPGVTRQKQWIRLKENIELLDTPGVLWPKFESEVVGLNLAYTGSIKDSVIEKVEIAFSLLKYLYKQYKTNLLERYKINPTEIDSIIDEEENTTILNLMYLIGRKRGTIISGGTVDEEKVANIILEDFRSGKLGKITLEKCK